VDSLTKLPDGVSKRIDSLACKTHGERGEREDRIRAMLYEFGASERLKRSVLVMPKREI